MKIWILLAIAGLLLLWSLVRERFEATPNIKAPPYTDAEKVRMYQMMSLTSQGILMAKAKKLAPAEKDDTKLAALAGGILAPTVASFFNTVYKPAQTTLRASNVNSFMEFRTGPNVELEKELLMAYFINQPGLATSGYVDLLAAMGQTPEYQTAPGATPPTAPATPPSGSPPPPVCPVGRIFDDDDPPMCVESTTTDFTCPTGYAKDGFTCKRVGGSEVTPPVCPTGKTFSDRYGGCLSRVSPTCPSGYRYDNGECVVSPGAGGGGGGGGATTSGTTTGGSSVTSLGPTSGGSSQRRQQVFGPVFTSMGAPYDGSQGATDTSRTNVYPELLGGMVDTSTRIPGVGITSPSKNWSLTQDGSLPSNQSLGSDEMSRYFPYSRTPGDMDVLPDPWRVAQTFSQSTYSSKTEPVPFLTDFSAFQK